VARKPSRLRGPLGLLSLLFLAVGTIPADGRPRYEYWHLDHFDAARPVRTYRPYHGEVATSWGGYGIYYEKAKVRLSFIPTHAPKGVLRISYSLPPHLDWGNWLSVRRELATIHNFQGYEGLALEVRTEAATNTRFRITLTDVTKVEDFAKHGADEMWWFDAPADLLTPGGKEVTVYAPFAAFYPSYGAGARRNDGRLDLSKIVAFEINLVSSGPQSGQGILFVDCLRAYRRR
jgi:hypothetical protein